jgi:hypothetical protein
MSLSFSEALARLTTDAGVVCRFRVGSASFDDEAEWERLGAEFDEAARAFTAAYGAPLAGPCDYPGQDVDRSACWLVAGKVLYALLTLEDNTRIRWLTLGVANRGEVRISGS